MGSWIRRSLLVLGSGAVALAGLELWARASWEAPWYQRLRTEQARHQELDYRTNRFELRDRDYPTPKPDDRLRLLILGDSFTHGMGVLEDELVFPELLERRLNELEWPGKSGVDVLNGGIPGSLPDEWVELWGRVADAFQPDAVMIVFFLRDGTKLGSMTYFAEIGLRVNEPNRASPLYRHSYLYRVLRDRQVEREFLDEYRAGFAEAYLGDHQQTRPWRRAQKDLLELRDAARQRGLPIGFAVFPILAQLREGAYPFQDLVDLLLDFGREAGMPTHDLLPAFRGRDAAELWVSRLDQHPNAAGHAIAADSLLPFAIELLRAVPGQEAAR